jgi:hypothetical protein
LGYPLGRLVDKTPTWIIRAVPIKINIVEVHLDFHIYPILDFDHLIGYPLERLHLENSSQGSLDNKA